MLIVVSSIHDLSMVNGESDKEVLNWVKSQFNKEIEIESVNGSIHLDGSYYLINLENENV